jgi:hypothetical protein
MPGFLANVLMVTATAESCAGFLMDAAKSLHVMAIEFRFSAVFM